MILKPLEATLPSVVLVGRTGCGKTSLLRGATGVRGGGAPEPTQEPTYSVTSIAFHRLPLRKPGSSGRQHKRKGSRKSQPKSPRNPTVPSPRESVPKSPRGAPPMLGKTGRLDSYSRFDPSTIPVSAPRDEASSTAAVGDAASETPAADPTVPQATVTTPRRRVPPTLNRLDSYSRFDPRTGKTDDDVGDDAGDGNDGFRSTSSASPADPFGALNEAQGTSETGGQSQGDHPAGGFSSFDCDTDDQIDGCDDDPEGDGDPELLSLSHTVEPLGKLRARVVDTCGDPSRRPLNLPEVSGASAILAVFNAEAGAVVDDSTWPPGCHVVLVGTRGDGDVAAVSASDRAAGRLAKERGWHYAGVVETTSPSDCSLALSHAAALLDRAKREAMRDAILERRAEEAAKERARREDPMTVRAAAGAARRALAPIGGLRAVGNAPMPPGIPEPCLISVLVETFVRLPASHGAVEWNAPGDYECDASPYEGNCRVTYTNGDQYEGEMHLGLPHGEGVYTYHNENGDGVPGAVYTGSFHRGLPQGPGRMRFPNGDLYIGLFHLGWRHGNGTLTSSTHGGTYTGGWNMGVRHGQGETVYPSRGATGTRVITGPGGSGNNTHASGDIDVNANANANANANSNANGDPNGSASYKGEWVANRPHGRGVMRYASGSVYTGDWVRGLREGHGVMEWVGLGERYTGEWMGGKQNGIGEHVWGTTSVDPTRMPVMNRYVGEHRDGKRCGRGKFFYSTGALYDGEWLDNCKHGHGTMTDPTGRRVSGVYDMDRLVVEDETLDTPPGDVEREARERAEMPGELGATLDLADLAGGDERTVTAVRDVILRHLGTLKATYARYAAMSVSARAGGANGRGKEPTGYEMAVLSLAEFTDCLVSAGVPRRDTANGIALANALRRDTLPIFTALGQTGTGEVVNDSESGEESESAGGDPRDALPQSQDPRATFLLRHFLEGIARAAAVTAPNVSLEDAVESVCQRITAVHGRPADPSTVTIELDTPGLLLGATAPFSALYASKEVQSVLVPYRLPIARDCVTRFAETRVPGDPCSAGLASARNILRELRSRGVVGLTGEEDDSGMAVISPSEVMDAVRFRYETGETEPRKCDPLDAQRDELGVGEVERLFAVLSLALSRSGYRHEVSGTDGAGTDEPISVGVTLDASGVAVSLSAFLSRVYPSVNVPEATGGHSDGGGASAEGCYDDGYEHHDEHHDEHDGDDYVQEDDDAEDVFSEASEEYPEHE